MQTLSFELNCIDSKEYTLNLHSKSIMLTYTHTSQRYRIMIVVITRNNLLINAASLQCPRWYRTYKRIYFTPESG